MTLAVLVLLACVLGLSHPQTYIVDDTAGLGRRFDGIGGLSGGGVSWKNHKSSLHTETLYIFLT